MGTQIGRFETTNLPRGHRPANPPEAPHMSSQDAAGGRAQMNAPDHLADAIAALDAAMAMIDRMVRRHG